MSFPKPPEGGLFEPVLGRAPQDWPWALPHLYAINYAEVLRDDVVAATASPDGTYTEGVASSKHTGRVEVIGFWQQVFRVVHVEERPSYGDAIKSATLSFSALPVRFLFESGKAKQENTTVEITGNWPEKWLFSRVQDFGVFCSYLYERCKDGGRLELADDFRNHVHLAWPATEQLIVYLHALEFARNSLSQCLSEQDTRHLGDALASVQRWLAT